MAIVEQIQLRCMNFFGVNQRGRIVARNRLVYGSLICVAAYFLLVILYYVRSLFPEIDMIIFSRCLNPIQNWDGKILDVPVWPSSYANRPEYFNIQYEEAAASNNELANLRRPENQPVIIWGTHHKTGTFLAKKLFSRVCAKMGWCCLFHVTRDSVHAVSDAIVHEPVDALGHNQWVWHPRELNITNYYFIHFYRHPFKKIVSGYKYHYDGTEVWTQKPTLFSNICKYSTRLSAQAATSPIGGTPNRDDVFEYCKGTHLCQTCCRREHEIAPTIDSNGYSSQLSFKDKTLSYRTPFEYDYICEHLGKMNTSLQHTLQTVPENKGLLVEAALDFYENLRMAVLVNQTADDSRTLNIDLDYLTANYHEGTWLILRHLKDIIPPETLMALHGDLQFFDLNNSPVYRWSMSNPIINHVTSGESSSSGKKVDGSEVVRWTSKQMNEYLKKHPDVQRLYQPLLEKMHKVISKRPNTLSVAAPEVKN